MEEDARELLAAVNALCGDGWQLLEEAELAKRVPDRKEAVSVLLERLSARGLVGLRYAEGGVYCVCALPAGRAYAARLAEEEASLSRRGRALLRKTFWAAFFGALAGALSGAAFWLLFSLVR